MLLSEWFLLPWELDFKVYLINGCGFRLNVGVVEGVSQFLFHFLFFQWNGLASLNGISVDGYFRNAVCEDGAAIGVDDEETRVILKVAGIWQFSWVLTVRCHFNLVGEGEFRLVVAISENIYFVVAVKDGGHSCEREITVGEVGLCDVLHSSSPHQLLLMEYCLFCQIQQIDASHFVSCQQVVVAVAGR